MPVKFFTRSRRVLILAAAVGAGILIGMTLRLIKERQEGKIFAPVSPAAGTSIRISPEFSPGRTKEKVVPHLPRVALVIDDWGYNLKNLKLLAEIKRPLTLAVLPHCRFSEKIAREGKRLGCQIILHLPLASANQMVKTEPFTISARMRRAKVEEAVARALASVPEIVGVSNHMGSAATEDPGLMRLVLAPVKEKDELFFLDSLTTPRSVCREICRQLELPFLCRDVFLDVELGSGGEDDSRQIAGRLRQLVETAKRRGRAVGIGHDRRLTLTVIRDNIPELEAEGVQFVHLAELLD